MNWLISKELISPIFIFEILMGNKFETECNTFLRHSTTKLKPPQYLFELLQDKFSNPFEVYSLIKRITVHWLNYSYLLRKKEFLMFAESALGLEPSDEGKRLYKLFKSTNSQGHKVVNALEIISILVLLADFSEDTDKEAASSAIHKSELIEHKINLILILFDLRD